jgi:hypothetical protein
MTLKEFEAAPRWGSPEADALLELLRAYPDQPPTEAEIKARAALDKAKAASEKAGVKYWMWNSNCRRYESKKRQAAMDREDHAEHAVWEAEAQAEHQKWLHRCAIKDAIQARAPFNVEAAVEYGLDISPPEPVELPPSQLVQFAYP